MSYSQNDWRLYSDELYHHGIMGQKWGVKNGPPYPLSESDHSAAEKKAGWKTSLMGASKADRDKRRKQKEKEAAKKAKEAYTKMNSEDYSDNSEVWMYAAKIALDVLLFNPEGLARDAIRGAQAIDSHIKTNKFAKERIGEKTDPSTGFKVKKDKMSEKDDLVRVNPSVNNFDSNTKSNCMLCTTAYDLRRRGYDVQAKTAGAGFAVKSIKDWYPDADIKSVKMKDASKYKGLNAKTERKKDAISRLTKQLEAQGEGARGNLCLEWDALGPLSKDTFSAGGHSVIWEVSGGKVVIRDAQINRTYNKPEKYLLETTGDFQYARTDNIDFDRETIKRCCG